MQTTRQPLDVLQVEKPCTADWESMRGDERVRFCDHCQRHVHDLSAMTEDEAIRLVCDGAGQQCVRFSRDERGRTATLNYQPTEKRGMTWRSWALFGAGAAVLSWVVGVIVGVPHKTTTVMGAMPAYYPATMGSPRAKESAGHAVNQSFSRSVSDVPDKR